VKKKEPIVKISFSGSDSGQYRNVEPPGMEDLGDIEISFNCFWFSRRVPVTIEARMGERVRMEVRDNISVLKK